MSEFNSSLLKANIQDLLTKNNMSQKDLADLIHSHQPTVSKMLNPNEDIPFSVEQLFIISQQFNVSLDFLIGNNINISENTRISPKEICAFFAKLLGSGYLSWQYSVIDEKNAYIFPLDEFGNEEPYALRTEKKVNYNTFYFSNYWSTDTKVDSQDEFEEYMQLLHECGNYQENNASINAFFNKFLKIHTLYTNGELPEEAYNHVLDAYLAEFK